MNWTRASMPWNQHIDAGVYRMPWGSECWDDPHGAIQSLLTHSGPIRNLNLSSTPIGRCFSRQKLVVGVVGLAWIRSFRAKITGPLFSARVFFEEREMWGGAVCGVFQGTSTFSVFLIFPFKRSVLFLLYTLSEWVENNYSTVYLIRTWH